MKVLITGSTGLIGSALVAFLRQKPHQVLRLVRSATPDQHDVPWNPERGLLNPGSLEGLDAVVHLAGENVGAGRWTTERKRRILESRTQGTRLLTQALSGLKRPPKMLISASAVGYYGNAGSGIVDEDSPSGEGFLSEVCVAWEGAADAARTAGIRVVHPRFGVVLSPKGGALKQMLPVFRAGLGGRLGNGTAWMSWISLPDAVSAVECCLLDESLSGPINVVSPNPVTNAEFTTLLAQALRRPAIFHVPEFIIRTLFGQMGRELLLASVRAKPLRLTTSGFTFAHTELAAALQAVLSADSVA